MESISGGKGDESFGGGGGGAVKTFCNEGRAEEEMRGTRFMRLVSSNSLALDCSGVRTR